MIHKLRHTMWPPFCIYFGTGVPQTSTSALRVSFRNPRLVLSQLSPRHRFTLLFPVREESRQGSSSVVCLVTGVTEGQSFCTRRLFGLPGSHTSLLVSTKRFTETRSGRGPRKEIWLTPGPFDKRSRGLTGVLPSFRVNILLYRCFPKRVTVFNP